MRGKNTLITDTREVKEMYPKFRVWNPKKEKMIYKVMVGNCDPNDKNWTCPVVYEEGIGWYHFEDFKYITQSTHTFDQNKKEIFEGDVLQIEQIKAIVRFGLYRYYEGRKLFYGNGFYFECLNVMDPDCIAPFETNILATAKIIGNIFENPELSRNFVGYKPK